MILAGQTGMYMYMYADMYAYMDIYMDVEGKVQGDGNNRCRAVCEGVKGRGGKDAVRVSRRPSGQSWGILTGPCWWWQGTAACR